jgi:Xaa-Pro aminopeptidase
LNIYQQRRTWLANQLDDNSVVIVVGNCPKTRSKNINYHFRPDNDLYYLTGFSEPNAVAVIRPGHANEYVLFVRNNNAAAEINFGRRTGLIGAVECFNADQGYDVETINQQLPELLEQREKIYLLDEQGFYQDQQQAWINLQRRSTGFDIIKIYRQLLLLQPILHNARVVKSAEEIALIKQAVAASVVGHKAVMKACKVGMNECQLEAVFAREVADFGCREMSYPSIVASGNNGCCLHYEENNSLLEDNKLLLIDAGAEYQHYCSDITRTWPINGRFSTPQAQIYQLVLNAIDAAISKVKPGFAWNEIYQTCVEVMAQGLLELGILSGSFEQVMQDESYRKFTVHKTGHWLGMDVHDVGAYHDQNGNWKTLVPNMVFTIEPGIYIPEDCLAVEEKWRGIAIRIEDDILVTEAGHENLSVDVPRTILEIEQYMK